MTCEQSPPGGGSGGPDIVRDDGGGTPTRAGDRHRTPSTAEFILGPANGRTRGRSPSPSGGGLRFPFGLTLAAAVVFVICCALGVWQLQRFAWKEHELARIAALRSAPLQPIGPVLASAARGRDVSFARVSVDCPAPARSDYTIRSDAGQWAWRVSTVCRLSGAPYASIMVVRGILESSRGSTTPPTVQLPPPGRISGVLVKVWDYQLGRLAWDLGREGRGAPYWLDVEREDPSAPGVTPRPIADQAPQALHYVGAYAPTWFGLAAVVAGVYAAMLWRRARPKA
jgi:surfeit locus 1 family protein